MALVLLLRARWFTVNKKDEDGRAIPELAVLMPALDELKTADLRPLARELEMRLNPVDADNLKQLADLLQLGADDIARLATAKANHSAAHCGCYSACARKLSTSLRCGSAS